MPDDPKRTPSVSDIVQLRYRESDGTLSGLPEWAKFFMELGSLAASPLGQSDEKRVYGLSIPTRSFASAFAAVGAVIGSIGGIDEQRTDQEYFDFLCSLPANTPIKHRDKNKNGKSRLYDGIILTAQEMAGQMMLKIQREKASMNDSAASGLTFYIQKDRVRDVFLPSAEDGITIETLPTSQKGSRVVPTSGFTASTIGQGSIANFESESTMTCLIVGASSVLNIELTEQKFLTDDEVEGTLAELLRIKKLLTPGSPYRSNVFATNSRRPPRYKDDLVPALVVFDGAQGFLKWRDNFPSSHWLVLLDSTSPNFESGRNELNNRYLQRSETEPSLDSFPVLPEGVEMIVFQEKKR